MLKCHGYCEIRKVWVFHSRFCRPVDGEPGGEGDTIGIVQLYRILEDGVSDSGTCFPQMNVPVHGRVLNEVMIRDVSAGYARRLEHVDLCPTWRTQRIRLTRFPCPHYPKVVHLGYHFLDNAVGTFA